MTTTTPTEHFTFSGPPGQFTPLERTIDLRVGGKERLKGIWSYVNARRISVSLATVVLTPEDRKSGSEMLFDLLGGYLQ